MNIGRRIISVIVCGFIVTVSVRADMVPLSQQDAGRRQAQHVCDKINLYNKNVSSSFDFPGVAYLGSRSVGFLPQANADLGQASEIQPLQSFTNGPGSLNLCLSALIGLGLCSKEILSCLRACYGVSNISVGMTLKRGVALLVLPCTLGQPIK